MKYPGNELLQRRVGYYSMYLKHSIRQVALALSTFKNTIPTLDWCTRVGVGTSITLWWKIVFCTLTTTFFNIFILNLVYGTDGLFDFIVTLKLLKIVMVTLKS